MPTRNSKPIRRVGIDNDFDPLRALAYVQKMTPPGGVKPKMCRPGTVNGHLYLMYAPETDQYKIGISHSAHRRREAIERAAGVEVRLIDYWTIESGLPETESYLHESLAQYRTRGEWFRFPNDFTEEDVRSLVDRGINGF